MNKEELEQALRELGEVDKTIRGEIAKPEDLNRRQGLPRKIEEPSYPPDKPVATRKAYGTGLETDLSPLSGYGGPGRGGQ